MIIRIDKPANCSFSRMKYLITIFGVSALASAFPQYSYDDAPIYKGPPAPLGHDGRVIDTPEVAAAKAVHFAAYEKVASQLPYSDEPEYIEEEGVGSREASPYTSGSYSSPSKFSNHVLHDYSLYDGPAAPLNHDGRVLDTPEVAQAKAAHFAAYNQAASGFYHQGVQPAAQTPYVANLGHHKYAPLAHDGRVIDTPEVAHAKAAHLAAHAKALSQAREPAHYNNYY